MIWRWVYGAATYLLAPPVFAYFFWRGRAEAAYRRHWRERLGFAEPRDGRPLWVHAASVGEVILVAPLVEALIECHPDYRVLLTTFTPTGRDEARRRLGDRVDLAYLPLDTPDATRRFFRRTRPIIGVLAETELWPNLVAAAERAGVPLALVNASLSARSAARYRQWPVALAARFMLARFALIAAAEPVHAERFIAAGAPADVVEVVGNLKYDRADNARARSAALALRQRWQAVRRPVWLAASTHAPEEARLLDAFAMLRARHPNLLWILAPRHPQRFDTVERLLQDSRWRYVRRSLGEAVDTHTDIVLADTLGELDLFYGLADVAFVGGSLTSRIGGHNVIEPAAAACVFVTGSDIAAWREAMTPMIEAGGAAIARDATEVAWLSMGWLNDETNRRLAGQRLAGIAASHRGALARTSERIGTLLAARE
ncbi:3-deoxy-D-manno-octulosonic acid transferase [Salinisphaera sp.]|uniref:3-deoxy-D-manno-octulosonic acid transferase n=1 Tax=Salinisphaera sp. TaxID=1914330 RepID=UPI002D77F21D|nr:3-deoxy-D-manno-octulosonic acid transferase [Salinisphaera sp.]HET7313010.1 3-deoxy-D-manno-octulosonic acid transferase [Salinisphaera sp.]